MSEVNPLIAAILATAIIEPTPRKSAARRAVAAYREVFNELGKEAQELTPKPEEPPPGSVGPEQRLDRKPRQRVHLGHEAARRSRR